MMCVLFIDGMAGDINNERLDHKVYVRKGMNTSQLCVIVLIMSDLSPAYRYSEKGE